MAWLSGWTYRKSISVSSASASAANYQMKLLVGESASAVGEQVDCNSHVLSTFDDLRFTNSDGQTLLDYWIESITGTASSQLATVWIEFDSIDTTATTGYMYYGKTGAPAVSNGDTTFITFDGFERGSNEDTVGGNWTVSTGCTGEISTDFAYTGSRSMQVYKSTATPRVSIPVTASNNIAIQFRAWKDDAVLLAMYHGDGTHVLAMRVEADEDVSIRTGASYVDTGLDVTRTADLIEFSDFVWGTPTVDVWVNGSTVNDVDMHYDSTSYANIVQLEASNIIGYDFWIDNFIVRNFLTTEPTWGSFGGESENSGTAWELTLADGSVAADAYAQVTSFARSFTEEAQFSEVYSWASTFVRTFTDGSKAADVLARATTYVRTFTDSFNAADTWAGVTTWIRTFTDGSKVADAYARVTSFARSFTEEAQFSEVYSTVSTFIRTFTDGSKVADVLAKAATYVRTFTDSFNASDTLVKDVTKPFIEGVKTADAPVKDIAKSITEGSVAADVWSHVTAFARSFTEGSKVADTATKVVTWVRTFTEGFHASDTWAGVTTWIRTFTEGSKAADIYAQATSFIRSFTEGSKVADVYSEVTTWVRSFTEGITVADLWSKAPIVWIRNFAEGVRSSDTLSRATISVRSFIEGVKISEEAVGIRTWAHGIWKYTYTHVLMPVFKVAASISNIWTEKADRSSTWAKKSDRTDGWNKKSRRPDSWA